MIAAADAASSAGSTWSCCALKILVPTRRSASLPLSPNSMLTLRSPPWATRAVDLSTARVAQGGDRSVSIELGLKGSDADRLVGTSIFNAQHDQVDPALLAASAAAIIAYLTAHVAVTGADGKACASGQAELVPDGDGV